MKSSAKQKNLHGMSRLIYYENQNSQNENRLLQVLLCALSVIAVSTHHIFPKYSDTLILYHTCPIVRTQPLICQNTAE